MAMGLDPAIPLLPWGRRFLHVFNGGKSKIWRVTWLGFDDMAIFPEFPEFFQMST
jgi:hypothetical protein